MNGLLLTGAWFAIVASVGLFAYWASIQIRDAAEDIRAAVDLLAEDREFSREAADDAANAVKILRTWWSEAVYVEQQPEPQPSTQPHLPPTMPETRAVTVADDTWVAEQMAAIMRNAGVDQPEKPKPAPRKRTGSTAAKKAAS